MTSILKYGSINLTILLNYEVLLWQKIQFFQSTFRTLT